MTNFDLHMHSNVSRDGELTPTELIKMAKAKGLEYVALSDHNNFRGIDEMISEGNKVGITVIPAIEFDTMFEDKEVHLLGYNFDYHLPYFQGLANRIDQYMDEAMAERFVKFRENYHVKINEEEVYANTPEGENPFFILCDMMLNDPANKDIPDFQDYLKGGKRSEPQVVNFYWDKCSVGTKNYVKVNYPDFQKTVDIIHDAGGIAVLAHPWKTFYQNEALLNKAIAYGIDGIEAYSNYHEDCHNAYYEQFCKKHQLLITCGSDFHGSKKPKIQLGEYGYTKDNGEQYLNAFLDKLKMK
ncbi:MAG: PHP domain-containing protein [Erysipelotrichia bacterium]|nr:PHP domain-containing protein [Erysipelotrichia bacterium]NCC54923.1 PHP domain-containing protein [Erysipelotrichia bacterium]